MSYQVLARKYRPKSFETLVGQEHVVRALSHALDQQRLHHAYLFTGTRGVGKTTLSRILAKSFNCQGPDGNGGITSHPCGVCEACVAIDAGRFVDYIEMDAASNRGVDEMAQLLEQAVYAPSNARFKVYMIDEVHMLTNHAFNSMLKTLEEPPEHVKFILATTDPQKIPVTVLSRCLQFNLKQMPPGHIVGHLENILGQEQIEFEMPALRLLSQGAHGSMRDALSLTDQAIAYAAGKVTLEAVQGMLGALDQSYLIRLLDALAANDGRALLDVADEMAARSLSYKAALQDLGTLLHQIAIAQMVPAAVADELPEREDVLRLATAFDKEEVQLFYQIAVHGRNELALAPDEYAGFSMTLLRMLAFRPAEGSKDHVQGGPPSRPPAGRPAAPAGSPPASVAPARPKAASPVQSAPAASPQKPPGNINVVSAPVPQAQIQAQTPPAAPAVQISAQVSVQAEAPAVTAKPALSPAMAALAAARSGVNKPATAAPTPPVAVSAAVSPSVAPAPTRAAPPVAAAPVAVASRQQMDPADDMPPPWDDDVTLSTTRPSVNSNSGNSGSSGNAPARAANAGSDRWDDIPDDRFGDSLAASMGAAQHEQQHSAAGEYSATEAVTATAVAEYVAPAPAVAAPGPASFAPVAELGWDGHWPNLAAALPVRGVAQQLAQQSELVSCEINGNAVVFHLRVPLPTLLSAGSVDKLIAALGERFERTVRVETQIGAVEQTANAQAIAERAARQKLAEQSIQNDSFIQTLMREFGATIVTGSIRPV
ncbi:DNA polymerase III subunit gamma/tau [Undibacterium sp. TJN25]|uniref:DNA polymerase III subunit gamma/tau n=1 Tax=Undibacterium sp. TJN25 TaxID=3413056 RepID=UPI003BF3C58A